MGKFDINRRASKKNWNRSVPKRPSASGAGAGKQYGLAGSTQPPRDPCGQVQRQSSRLKPIKNSNLGVPKRPSASSAGAGEKNMASQVQPNNFQEILVGKFAKKNTKNERRARDECAIPSFFPQLAAVWARSAHVCDSENARRAKGGDLVCSRYSAG